jgi:NAD(P)-dependent dehydrogenase (short-subunit alcohol dehydrogenase family)
VCDVSDPDAVDRVLAASAPLDIVINAAAVQGGAGAIGALWDTEPKAVASLININLFGSYVVLRGALRRMRAQKRGSVILFSGGGSTGPRPGFDAYGATKTGVLRLAESAQKALDDEGSTEVRVFAIAPGAVSTAMTQEVLAYAALVPNEASAAREVAEGQGGVPASLAADLCLFLAEAEARPLAGRLVHVKESYRAYVTQQLDSDAGRLRRAAYPRQY